MMPRQTLLLLGVLAVALVLRLPDVAWGLPPAHAENPGVLTWSTFGESAAPHDWKYAYATYWLYRKKSP